MEKTVFLFKGRAFTTVAGATYVLLKLEEPDRGGGPEKWTVVSLSPTGTAALVAEDAVVAVELK